MLPRSKSMQKKILSRSQFSNGKSKNTCDFCLDFKQNKHGLHPKFQNPRKTDVAEIQILKN